MSRNNDDQESRIQQLEAAMRQLIAAHSQPGCPTAPWMRTALLPGGKIGTPRLHPALEAFVSDGVSR